MKKFLMFCLAIASVACVQAVSINWKADGDNSWYANTQSSYAIVNAINGANSIDQIVAAAKGEVAGDDYNALKTVTESNCNSVSIGQDANHLRGTLAIGSISGIKDLSGSYYLVLFNADCSKYAMTEFSSSCTEWNESVGPGLNPSLRTVTFTGTAVVPEPTALALLALGIAGLALRRRA